VAAHSCLYWAWYRRNRIVRDLSHGWGSNSQWDTDFRRDYLRDTVFIYNIDGRQKSSAHDPDLSTTERDDLLRYRHSVRRDLGEDRFPYDHQITEPRLHPSDP
jgi:hypothetical protein